VAIVDSRYVSGLPDALAVFPNFFSDLAGDGDFRHRRAPV